MMGWRKQHFRTYAEPAERWPFAHCKRSVLERISLATLPPIRQATAHGRRSLSSLAILSLHFLFIPPGNTTELKVGDKQYFSSMNRKASFKATFSQMQAFLFSFLNIKT